MKSFIPNLNLLFFCLLVTGVRPAFARELLDQFPIVLQSGLAVTLSSTVGVGKNLADSGKPLVLADLPFSAARGYGYVGGQARILPKSSALGGDPRWLLSWRESPRKYSFHIANAKYLLRLYFLETDAAYQGIRVFDVHAEGVEFVRQLDIVREIGDFHWLSLEGIVNVKDGWLDLEFKNLEGKLPARISRIEILQADVETTSMSPPSGVQARGVYLSNQVYWKPVPCTAAGLAGYGVFRSESENGPYDSLTSAPILATEFNDTQVLQGKTYYYRVRAYGLHGGQSSFSPTVNATPHSRTAAGMKVFELKIPPDQLPRLLNRSHPQEEVRGNLLYSGRSDIVRIMTDSAPSDWQFRKSFRVDLESGRRFFRRKTFQFRSESGDPTFLREKLFFGLVEKLGLASPQVEPVHLLMNGRDKGVFLSREEMDTRFLKRTRLDDRGVFVRAELKGSLPFVWSPPHGEQIGRGGGGLSTLGQFYSELRLIDEGEMEEYFNKRFYLDRLMKRLALSAICGRNPNVYEDRLFLGDSRNGKWEILASRSPDGAFGISFFRQPLGSNVTSRQIQWSLFGGTLLDAFLPYPDWQLLETRLLNLPRLRKMFLDTIDEIYRFQLTEQSFENMVDDYFKSMSALLGDQRDLWPMDGSGEMFEKGPDLIKDYFKAHRLGLLEEISRIKNRYSQENIAQSEPLVISEFLLRSETRTKEKTATEITDTEITNTSVESIKWTPLPPASLDGAWIEIWNRSSQSVRLGSYRLLIDPAHPKSWALPDIEMAVDERKLITLGSGAGTFHCPLRPNPGGGILLLSLADKRGRAKTADLVFYGHQTAGFSYGRSQAPAQGNWGFLAQPTPGLANIEDESKKPPSPPSWRFSWKLELEKDGSMTISMRPGSRVNGVLLCMRPPGKPDFEGIPMDWADKEFRYKKSVPRLADDANIPFFFLAQSENGLERPFPITGRDLPFYTPSRPKIFINEVLSRPLLNGEFGEFVEIYNAEDIPVSIEGMYLTDQRRNTVKWRIPLSEPVPPKGFVVLFADGIGKGIHAPFKLSNSGEYLGLYHRYEEGNILVDHMTFNAVPLNHSWGRRQDGKKGFRVWKDPTPGGRNLPKIPEEYLEGQRQK